MDDNLDIPQFLRRDKNEVNDAPLPEQPVKEPEQVKPVEVVAEKEAANTRDLIQRGMRENASELIAEINEHYDELLNYGHLAKKFVAYDFLKEREVKPAIAKLIAEKFEPQLHELNNWKSDPDLVEAYSRFDSATRRAMRSFLETLLADIDRWTSNTPRKPRVVKIVPANKVKALKFKKEDADLKLVSIAPEKIIGAHELWAYNTKNRKLTLFKARTRDGLMVKGGSITEYDVDTSVVKILRKPADTLTKVLEKKKKVMEGLTTKGAPPVSGRITADMILVRVG